MKNGELMMEKPYLLKFPSHGDEKGKLVVVEGCADVPFEIKRIFYIYGSDSSVVRGQHANRKSEFVLINVAGSCKVRTDDGRGNQQIFILDKPNEGMYIPKMLWKDMYDFSADSVLLCLSSEHYDNSEYIRNYDEYVSEMRDKIGD